MGGSLSAEEVPAFDLPQQQIVSLDRLGQQEPSNSSRPSRRKLATVKQAFALRPTLMLTGNPRQEPSGVLVPLRASAAGGAVELLSAAQLSEEAWPRVLQRRQRWCQEVGEGAHEVHVAGAGAIDAEGCSPLLIVLHPGESSEPPADGTVMVFCSLDDGCLSVQKQIIAWKGQAFLLQKMFGLQELHAAGDETGETSTSACVICLTAPKSTAVLPCGHFCCCCDCAVALRFNLDSNKCPLCRNKVEDLLHLDMTEPRAAAEAGEAVPSGEASPSVPVEVPEVPQVSSESPEGTGASTGPRPRALQRLNLELRQAQTRQQQLRGEHQLELSLSDAEAGDLSLWKMLLYTEGFAGNSSLSRELQRWQVEAVELELYIPQNFPEMPPFVRVMSPCFAPGSFYVQEHGALCMEVLTPSGWSPALRLPQLGVQIKDLLTAGQGRLLGAGPMAPPTCAARKRAMEVARAVERLHDDWRVPAP